MARGRGATGFAGVVLPGDGEAVGPAVVEANWISQFGVGQWCGGVGFWLVVVGGHCTSKAPRGTVQGTEAVFVG